VSEHQPIDLDDLQRVSVTVREKTDDNWLADMVEIACDEIARLREERLIVTLPMPFEPWRHGPLSYRKCEVLAALRKAGVKWRKLPPGPEGDG
jgi:hypothetical protein